MFKLFSSLAIVSGYTMQQMMADDKVYTDQKSTAKTNVTVENSAGVTMVYQYYSKRLRNPSNGQVMYQWHGNCFVDAVDTATWTPETADQVMCTMIHFTEPTKKDWFVVSMNYKGNQAGDANDWTCVDGHSGTEGTITPDTKSNCMVNNKKSKSFFVDPANPETRSTIGYF